MTTQGTCDSCGKAYRLPAAGRAYTCKACGGTVRATAETEPEPEPSVEGKRHAPGHHGSVIQHREAIDARRRAAARKTRLVWGALLIVLVGAGVGFQLSRPKSVLAAGGVVRDLEAGTAELVQAWNAGDVEALVQAFHPDGRASFRARLQRAAENRGWTGGFTQARAVGSSLTEGTAAQPLKAVTLLACGDEELRVKVSLQFEPSRDRWYVYHVDIPPPPLAPALARFRAAWAQSSPEALTPLFPPDEAKKLTDSVERKTRELAWSPDFPELGEATTTGEQELRRATEPIPGLRVETVFAVAERELKLRWQYRSEPDAWYLAALTFPKKE